jgi:hypothetical protein
MRARNPTRGTSTHLVKTLSTPIIAAATIIQDLDILYIALEKMFMSPVLLAPKTLISVTMKATSRKKKFVC